MTKFDGRRRTGAMPIGPIHYHPAAPATGVALSASLESAYYRAQQAGLIVGVQTGFMLDRTARYYLASLVGGIAQVQTGYVNWARMLRHVPAHYTHACFWCQYVVIGSGAPATVNVRIEVTDGTTTTTGSPDSYSATYEPARMSVRGGSAVASSTFRALPRGSASGSVALSALTLDANIRFLVEGQATMDQQGGSTVGQPVRPELVVVWLECRPEAA